MTTHDLTPALERAAKFAATLDATDVIDDRSGFSVADLRAIMVAAEPETIEDQLNEKLGDVA
ncbi:hypothetical protein OKW76_05260 [Sphingomonas sp. S1-29]|uniref:hypothetical protein n=1 Tax=Sphingomonas sp. S1-29 TaxID=2991074 RepID=UPI0022406293|nr:hypothetical protein [Sphingomonas sp. S1-29]UZK70454.1 hypothetical protein OKW76_05260 [Sphingomonas sp. S1-29]